MNKNDKNKKIITDYNKKYFETYLSANLFSLFI